MVSPLPRSHFEHAPVAVFADRSTAAKAVAAEIAALIRVRAEERRPVVLGLATGSTPVPLYAELVRLHREERLSFAHVTTFNLDEYYGLQPNHPQSYRQFMQSQLFDHVDILPANTHVPRGTVPLSEVEAHCARYEEAIRAAGGIDYQILGIGRTGHIGFNEPGSQRASRTRLVVLDPLTRRDAAPDFGDERSTPRQAITIGVRTILEARRVVLMAWGGKKAAIACAAVEGDATSAVPASFLQEHDHAVFVLDRDAAADLTRYRAPWLLGDLAEQGLAWDDRMRRRAILWLAARVGKAILKLTDDDYNAAGLQDLVRIHGSAYEANRSGFYQLQHTITGWPGGRDPRTTVAGDAPVRPLRAASAKVFPKRVIVFSPHPDDDVVSMGGTLCRLVDQGHEVHVACQVSGANAVSDEMLLNRIAFAEGVAAPAAAAGVPAKDGELRASRRRPALKGLIRRIEAKAAARVCGIPPERLHFLDLPFYEAATPRERRLTAADVRILHELLSGLKPHLVFAAGDLDDPHGTHRICLDALAGALDRAKADPWLREAEVWLYRGAWSAWPAGEIDMAVPLSPQEVLRRRAAIFRHESQKDMALFPGDDPREFWQRAEDRSRNLAATYNALGLAEYEAIEAFRRYSPEEFMKEFAR
jgi:glucosamine-6-phosphate deaminase